MRITSTTENNALAPLFLDVHHYNFANRVSAGRRYDRTKLILEDILLTLCWKENRYITQESTYSALKLINYEIFYFLVKITILYLPSLIFGLFPLKVQSKEEHSYCETYLRQSHYAA